MERVVCKRSVDRLEIEASHRSKDLGLTLETKGLLKPQEATRELGLPGVLIMQFETRRFFIREYAGSFDT
jgi:hypothetical protein